ncbi:MAG: 50S ribosomal protein P1 [Candidatus Micrarchaeia archaeon]
MEYVYAALLLDAAKKEINENNIMEVLKAAGFNPDEARAKAVAEALKGVNIEEVIKNAQLLSVQQAPAHAEEAKPASAKAEKNEKDEKKEEENAASGLSSLFG